MSDKSPLFVSSLELIAHSTELYASAKQRNYKFVILHLANAVELILKDRVIDKGESIYETGKDNRTINIWESMKRLDNHGVKIHERPIIELLVDDRNTIQHRFGHPNAESVYYYLEQVISFFKRFLHDEYGVDLSEALRPNLSPEHLSLLGLTSDQFSYLEGLMKVSPEAAIHQGFNALLKEFEKIISAEDVMMLGGGRRQIPNTVLIGSKIKSLEQAGIFPDKTVDKFEKLRIVRNEIAHSVKNNKKAEDWRELLNTIKDIHRELQKAIESGKIKAYDSHEDNGKIEET